jgi:hypothetical protein
VLVPSVYVGDGNRATAPDKQDMPPAGRHVDDRRRVVVVQRLWRGVFADAYAEKSIASTFGAAIRFRSGARRDTGRRHHNRAQRQGPPINTLRQRRHAQQR